MPGFALRVQKRVMKQKNSGEQSQMDDAGRAMCYALRNPPDGSKPMRLKQIRKLVRKKTGRIPTLQAISKAAIHFKDEKGQRGRPKGCRKTTTAEDGVILKKFHKLRPPGVGIDSRTLHTALPVTLRKKVCRKTVIRCIDVGTTRVFGRECNSLHFFADGPGPKLRGCRALES